MLKGKILDIGSGHSKAEYLDYFIRRQSVEIVRTDLYNDGDVIALDITKPFHFDSETFDFVVAKSVFEHVSDFNIAPKEIHRILKENGEMYYSTPFLTHIHNYPDDFYRFTSSAIKTIWGKYFEIIWIKAEGGPFIVIFQIISSILKQIVRKFFVFFFFPLFYFIESITDRLFQKCKGIDLKEKYPLFYFARFRKK